MAEAPANLVVLGGSASIGAQCARIFTRAGWTCFIGDDDARALEGLQEELGDKIGHHCGDLETTLGLRNVLAGALASFDRIDALVHIPDIPDGQGFLKSDNRDFEEALIAPARSVAAAMRMFASQMLRQKKQELDLDTAPPAYNFIQIFALTALTGDRGQYSQRASQSMALAAAEAATLDLAEHKIRTNAIIALRPRAEHEEKQALELRTPLQRACNAEEIAQAAFYLAGAQAANVTGQKLILDGGRSQLNGLWSKDDDAL